MPIAVQCECGKRLKAPDSAAGRRARCPACGGALTVPIPVPVEEIPEPLPLKQSSADPIANSADPYDIAEDTQQTAAAAAERATAQRRRELAAKVQQSTVASRPTRSRLEPPAGEKTRPYRYVILLLTLLPLIWSTFRPDKSDAVIQRAVHTLVTHPEIADKIGDDPTVDQIVEAAPAHKLDGALLSHDTWAHWGFAALSAGAFFGLILLLFPPGHTKVLHLFFVAAFTSTLGIFLLLAVQWAAFHVPLRIGSSWITLIIDFFWLIGQSYSMALGDHGFLASALGFTAGVGFCEEGCKALPLIWKARDSGFVSWRSAMLWGLISGVGFGVSEGITYSSDYYNGIHGGQIYLVRFISCVALHGIWAAATGINVYRRQDHFRGSMHPLEWVVQIGITVIVPMILHGFYDTLLKQDYHWLAVAVALASFGWLAFQIELAKKKLDAEAA